MFGLGVTELVIILVVALIIFGPGKLPEIGGALGRGIRDFRKSVDGSDEDSPNKLTDAAKASEGRSDKAGTPDA